MKPARSGRSLTVLLNRLWDVSGVGISISVPAGKVVSRTNHPNGRQDCASSIISRSIDERKRFFRPHRTEVKRVAHAVVFSYGRYSTGYVRAFLYNFFCADDTSDKHIGEKCAVVYILRISKNSAVWRSDHTWR